MYSGRVKNFPAIKTIQPALWAEENLKTGLRPRELKPASPAAREGSGESPPRVRGGVSEADRRGVLSYMGKMKQFAPRVTSARRARANTTEEGTAFSFENQISIRQFAVSS